MPRPSFFIVGAPKCGTTSLCHYLNQHPDIFIPDHKELHFFASDLDLPRPFGTEGEYLATFAGTAKRQSGERTTWYLYSTTAARDIHDFNRNAKIIVAVRNPTDMLYSLFRYRRYIGTEKSTSFPHVLAREKQYFVNAHGITKIDPNHVYSCAALYYEQIRRYIETFGSASVHVVVFEDMKDHPEEVYRGILRFLGAGDDFRPSFRHVNKTGRIRSERFQQRIAHLPGPVKRLAYAFPRGIRRPAYRALHRLNTSYAPPPQLDPELRQRLNDDFRPDVERLSALLGRDLTRWCAG
jgi:Sulfotransferase domain